MTQITRTWVYLVTVNLCLLVFGYMAGDRQGLLAAGLLALGLNSLIFFWAPEWIIWTYRGIPLEGRDPFGILATVGDLSTSIGIPAPRVWIAPIEAPNLLIVGATPKRASLILTEGLVRTLTKEELQTVLAHKLYQISMGDSFMLTFTTMMAAVVLVSADLLAYVLALGKKSGPLNSFIYAIATPVASFFVHSGFFGPRIHLADYQASHLTKNPKALGDALWKIHNHCLALSPTGNLATTPLFIVNPFPQNTWAKWLNPHPKVEERIKRTIGRFPHQ